MYTMNQWNCCRLCSSSKSLNPIFQYPDLSNKYTNILFVVTGLKIIIHDSLPQKLCTSCVNIINQFIEFRRMCSNTYYNLIKKLSKKNISNNMHNNIIKKNEISISETSSNDMLDSDRVSCSKQMDEKEGFIEYETTVKDLLQKGTEIVFKNVRFNKKIECNKEQYNILEETAHFDDRNMEDCTIKKQNSFECEFCPKLFKSKPSFINHRKTHTGLNVICEHCGKKFMNKRRLLMHCKARHGYEKTDKCSYCDYRGSNAELVKIHERLHTGDKPYVCGACGCGFHRRSSYLQHVPTHLPEKTVACDECPAMFKSVTLMRIHKSRHRSRCSESRKRAENT